MTNAVHPKEITWSRNTPKRWNNLFHSFLTQICKKGKANYLISPRTNWGLLRANGSVGLGPEREAGSLLRHFDCWVTAAGVVLSGREASTSVRRGSEGAEQRWRQALVIKAALPPPLLPPPSSCCPPPTPPPFLLLSLAMDVTTLNRLATSGQGAEPRHRNMEGQISRLSIKLISFSLCSQPVTMLNKS